MQKVRLLVAVLVVSLMVSVSGVFAQDGNIVEVASGNDDLSTLVSLVEAAGLVDALSADDLTVFAPTNDAFAALGDDVLALLESDTELLTQVLTFHVVEGAVASSDLSSGAVDTLEGGAVNVVVDDAGVVVDNVNVVTADVEASNGIVHVVDGVLIPQIELPAVDPIDFAEGSIIAAGSSTVFPLSERMGELWSDAGGVAPSIDSIGSGAGFERFCVAGETDISNASRPIRDSEVESCESIDRDPIEFRVGTDALSVVVSTENDFVSDITLEELAMIFAGAETWSDVRAEWPEEPIARFIPGTDSGTFDFFVEEVYDEDEEPILSASNTQLSEDDNVLVQGVQGSEFAVGFFGFAFFVNSQDTLNALAIDGVPPNGQTAEDGSYPLARPLFIYSTADVMAEKPEVNAFINFYLTNVNDAVEDVGYFASSNRALNLARLRWLAAQ